MQNSEREHTVEALLILRRDQLQLSVEVGEVVVRQQAKQVQAQDRPLPLRFGQQFAVTDSANNDSNTNL